MRHAVNVCYITIKDDTNYRDIPETFYGWSPRHVMWIMSSVGWQYSGSAGIVALFPGLPRVQFLIPCSMQEGRYCILQVIKTGGRIAWKNEATGWVLALPIWYSIAGGHGFPEYWSARPSFYPYQPFVASFVRFSLHQNGFSWDTLANPKEGRDGDTLTLSPPPQPTPDLPLIGVTVVEQVNYVAMLYMRMQLATFAEGSVSHINYGIGPGQILTLTASRSMLLYSVPVV